MAFLIILLVMGIALVAVGTMLLISVWTLIVRRPSSGIAVWNLIVAIACGLYLARAIHWAATGNLLPAEWEHVAVPAGGIVVSGLLSALHFLGVRRDPQRV